ncbi:hypothetical protein E4U45_007932, partial [Claviceps purpurea]
MPNGIRGSFDEQGASCYLYINDTGLIAVAVRAVHNRWQFTISHGQHYVTDSPQRRTRPPPNHRNDLCLPKPGPSLAPFHLRCSWINAPAFGRYNMLIHNQEHVAPGAYAATLQSPITVPPTEQGDRIQKGVTITMAATDNWPVRSRMPPCSSTLGPLQGHRVRSSPSPLRIRTQSPPHDLLPPPYPDRVACYAHRRSPTQHADDSDED